MGNYLSCASDTTKEKAYHRKKEISKPRAASINKKELKATGNLNSVKSMPKVCSEELVEMPYTNSKRWPIIYNSLSNLYKQFSKEKFDLNEIEKAVMSYFSQFSNEKNFLNLYQVLNELNRGEIRTAILNIINLALRMPEYLKNRKLTLLKQGVNNSIKLTQTQCASILANAFFCTFPESNNKNLKTLNFIRY